MSSSLDQMLPRAMTQKAAAHYLGVSDRWFRDNVHVEAVPVNLPRPGVKPVLRYLREDLDAWLERCRTHNTKERATA